MEIELGDIHLAILLVTAVAILYSDHMGYAYMRGKITLLPHTLVRKLHYAVLVGLGLLIMTGVLLSLSRWEYLLGEPIFYVKMAFVGVLIFNAWAIGKMSHLASERPFAALHAEERQLLIFSGALSGIGWVVTAVIGYFFL